MRLTVYRNDLMNKYRSIVDDDITIDKFHPHVQKMISSVDKVVFQSEGKKIMLKSADTKKIKDDSIQTDLGK